MAGERELIMNNYQYLYFIRSYSIQLTGIIGAILSYKLMIGHKEDRLSIIVRWCAG